MSNLQRVAPIAVIALFAFAFIQANLWHIAGGRAEHAKAPQLWEYQSLSGGQEDSPGAQVEKMVNALGAEGWELVAVEPSTVYSHGNSTNRSYRVYHFKRPK